MDMSKLGSQPAHRLPTIPASQALQRQSTPRKQWVPTGLPQLDLNLRGVHTSGGDAAQKQGHGGYVKGQVTEIYGPPGSGKTALGLQAAAGAIHSGEMVVWIDVCHQLGGARLKAVLSHVESTSLGDLNSSPPTARSNDALANLHHFTVSTLPHLLAMICHPPPGFPLDDTSLLVIDGISSLLAAAFPDRLDSADKSGKKKDDAQWASNRRFSVMGDLLAHLTKMAAVKNLAVVLLSQTGIRVKQDYGAVLRPAISTKTWVDNVSNRVIVFRDFYDAPSRSPKRGHTGARFAGISKLNGNTRKRLFPVTPFTVDQNGIHELRTDLPAPAMTLVSRGSPLKQQQQRKRKVNEIADSESEGAGSQNDDEFGWVEDDALALQESLDADLGTDETVQPLEQEAEVEDLQFTSFQ